MEDFIGAILIFVVFVLGPILEQMRKKGQRRPPGMPPQQQRRPLPRPPESARLPQSSREAPSRVATQEPVTARTEEVSAAEMLPDELWEILTGQPKPKPAPPRPPAPDVEDEETADEELITAEDVTIETRRTRFEEAVSVEAPPPREYPVVVSMEEVPDPRKRHAAFHEKIQQSATAAPASIARARYFSTPADLRRAMILQVVLGPPKALEGPPQIR
jgi:hypothetical protein